MGDVPCEECAMLLQLGARSGGLVTVLDAEWERLKGDGKSREARKRRRGVPKCADLDVALGSAGFVDPFCGGEGG